MRVELTPEQAEQQRAIWRAQQAVKRGKEITQEDRDLLTQEQLDKILAKAPPKQETPQPVQASSVHQQPLNLSQFRQEQQKSQGSEDQPQSVGVKRDVGSGSKPTRAEKDWYSFFINDFGPWIVLLIWWVNHDLERATFLAPSPNECYEAAGPMSRLMPKVESMFHVPSWMHDAAMASSDIRALGFVFLSYMDRTGLLERLVPWYTGVAAQYREGRKNDTRPAENTGNVQSSQLDGYGGVQDISGIPIGLQNLPA